MCQENFQSLLWPKGRCMNFRRNIELAVVFLAWFGSGCVLMDDSASNKLSPTGLIATPPSYYSTAKARYLGTKYKENLDRLAERIVRNPTTAQLQFANNISSVGGIGFFTHSATETPDERYLEVVLATPETFESKREYSEKVHQLFSRYGPELLGIIAGDSEILEDQQLSGYGLNFSWRTVTSEASTNRVSLARAIIYFRKDEVAKFLRQGLSQSELLRDAVIFAIDDNGPLELVSYQPREIKPDFRPAIREDNLAPALAKPSQQSPSSALRREATKAAPVKKGLSIAQQMPARATNVPMESAEKGDTKTPAAAKPEIPLVLEPAESASPAAAPAAVKDALPPKADDTAEKLAHGHRSQSEPSKLRATMVDHETATASTKTMLSPTSDLTPPANAQELAEEPEVSDSAAVIASVPQPNVTGEGTRENTAQIRREEPTIQQTGARERREPETKVTQPPLPLPAVATSKASGEAVQLTPMAEIKPPEIIPVPMPTAKKPAPPRVIQGKVAVVPAPSMAKPEDPQPAKAIVGGMRTPSPRQPEKAVITDEPPALPTREIKAKDSVPPQEKITLPAAVKVAKPLETKPVATQEKPSETKEIARAPLSGQVNVPPAPKPVTEPVAKTAVPVTVAEPAKTPEVTNPGVPVVAPTARGLREARPAQEIATPSASVSIVKNESPAVATPAVPAVVASTEKIAEKPAVEQFASLKKPEPLRVEKKPLARRIPKPLEGFIIQIGFTDKEKAQNWAEKMEQRGYAVSVTEAGATGALRVRLGNFSARDDAERQLRSFKQEGMNGIVINLPQAFRPVAQSSVP